MWKIALLLMIWPLLAVAQEDTETVTDKASGLVVQVPEGWDREARREQGSVRFSAILDLAPGHHEYVTFEIVAERAQFGADDWIAAQKSSLSNVFKDAAIPFAVDKSFKVGGKSAVLVTIGGPRTSKSGEKFDQRVRFAAVQNDDIFLMIREISVNGAHEKGAKALAAMWNALSFRTPEGDLTDNVSDPEEGGATDDRPKVPVSTEPTPIEDKAGNFRLTFPPAWTIARQPPPDDKPQLRLVAQRLNDNGNVIGFVKVLRFTSSNASTFTEGTPTDFLNNLDRQGKFEEFYGKNTAGTRRPQVNEGILLGGAEKSGEFTYRSITAKEEDKIREAETLKRRGEKIEIPEYKPIVVRGRLALISPYIYYIEVFFNRAIADDEKMLAEYKAIMDSWEFLSTEALPPPLNVLGQIGDTRETRPDKKEGTKVVSLSGKRPYRVEIEYELPPGFVLFDDDYGKLFKDPEGFSMFVYAQDDKNNWIKIIIHHSCAMQLSEKNMKFGTRDVAYDSWKSNFESKARGVKVPRREQSVNLHIRGLGSGKGYKQLVGDVEGHRATLTGYLRDKSGWRHVITIETRGDGDKVWEKQTKDFFRSLRIKTQK